MSDHDDPRLTALRERLTQHMHLPCATYRVQFNATFTFTQAQHVVPYLHSLGISTCYASPYLKARAGSTHGYDVVDPQVLNPEIGSEADYTAFVQTLQAHGLGQILDIVPNHMGIAGGDNAWWMDVLENGPSSAYAAFFDIDWQPLKTTWRDKVLLPILGDHYGRVLENQELRLAYAGGTFMVQYYEHHLPLEPRSTASILTACHHLLRARLGDTQAQVRELQSILTALGYLPLYTERDPQRCAERQREQAIIRRRLATLFAACPELPDALDRIVQDFNGAPGNPGSFDRLHALLEAQAYRLSCWRVAAEEVNYRRFFDINDLAGVRMEDPAVFEATHQLILRLLEAGSITGVRIDHPDGLADPEGYLHRLQRAYVLRHCQGLLEAAAPAADAAVDIRLIEHMLHLADGKPLYVVVEKILEGHERLPTSWPVHGTTGYDFLNQLNGLFVDRRQAQVFRNLYADFVGIDEAPQDVLYTAKRLILETSMASELHALGTLLERLAATQRRWRDVTRQTLTAALRGLIACFPVYRTYMRPEALRPSATDRTVLDAALTQARQRHPEMNAEVLAYVHQVLQSQQLDHPDPEAQQQQQLFVQKFQQLTGPVMAKGLEDTTFYRYTPLASLNEVGGDPGQFGTTVTAFHRHNRQRQQHWPLAMLATSTHDTKRGEDMRARLNVLSEIPQVWRDCLHRWHAFNRPHLPRLDGQIVPSRQEEYLLYQTLLGAWPFEPLTGTSRTVFCERIQAYMRKALREAKVHTSWTDPHVAYEHAIDQGIHTLLDERVSDPFLADFRAMQTSLAQYGMWNSLAQTLLKLTVPGVPDIYQGSELWDLNLVDPDNRRPVDYALRQRYLAELQQRCQDTARLDLVRDLLHTRQDGRIKLYLIWQVLMFRRAQRLLFMEGAYVPLDVIGSKRTHVCAFARVYGAVEIVVVVPRFLTRLCPNAQDIPLGAAIWDDTRLALPASSQGGRYRQLLTGEMVDPVTVSDQKTLFLQEALAHLPVALLERVDGA